MIVRPTPRRCPDLVRGQRARKEAEVAERENEPDHADAQARPPRTAYTMKIASTNWPTKFEEAVEAAIARKCGWPSTKRRPSRQLPAHPPDAARGRPSRAVASAVFADAEDEEPDTTKLTESTRMATGAVMRLDHGRPQSPGRRSARPSARPPASSFPPRAGLAPRARAGTTGTPRRRRPCRMPTTKPTTYICPS